MSVTTVRLGQEMEADLDALANKLQRTRSWLINRALKEFIEKQALEQQRWQETLNAIDSVANGNVVEGTAVHAWLRTWGSANESAPPDSGQ